MKRNLVIIFTFFILQSFSFAGFGQKDSNFEISKNLDIYTTLFQELHKNYVDGINSGELMQTGIEAMLEELDPYTVYIPESRVEDYKLITTGQYGGIGSLIHTQGDYVIISEPYENYPAQKNGLKAGDIILEINEKSAKNKNSSEVSEILKGQPGTEIILTIERKGEKKPLKFEIIRENIKIENIPYYGMLNENIGYIKLTGFTQNAGNEVRRGLLELKKNNELKGVILDLRGNGGGLLMEAVNISNIFVDKGKLVVSTKGKLAEKNQEHKTRFTPVDTEIPLVVLVNNTSASASEIVSGALQDLDRAVVLGQRTFGKGLVQNVIPLSYNSQMKVTVAKYYIPSGRCIQAIDYSHKDDNGFSTKIPDSLINEFQTENGRLVYDGGGIEPDISMDARKYSDIAFSLLTKYHIFNYATDFYLNNPEIPQVEEFEINDEIYNEFVAYLNDKDYDYITRSEKKLEELKKVAIKENYFEAIEEEYNTLKEAMIHDKEADLAKHKDQINDILRLEIISRYYYQKGKVISALKNDDEVDEAIRILEDKGLYDSILNGTYTTEKAKEKNTKTKTG